MEVHLREMKPEEHRKVVASVNRAKLAVKRVAVGSALQQVGSLSGKVAAGRGE